MLLNVFSSLEARLRKFERFVFPAGIMRFNCFTRQPVAFPVQYVQFEKLGRVCARPVPFHFEPVAQTTASLIELGRLGRRSV